MDTIIQEGKTATQILFPSGNEKLTFRLKKGSRLSLWHFFFDGMETNFDETVVFEEEGASAENHTIFFGGGSQNFQMKITHLHEAPQGTSRIFSRGILKDAASAKYDGVIKIGNAARKTDAFLEEKTLLLSAEAKSEAIPALEIGTNDVKAAHSASCTRVDENQLFYAASRGIPESAAIRLISEGFLQYLLSKLPDKKLKNGISILLRKKLETHSFPSL